MGKSVISAKPGQSLNITCLVNQQANNVPSFIYWEKDQQVLNFIESNRFRISDNLDQLRPYSANQNPDDNPNSNEPSPSPGQFQHVHTHNSPPSQSSQSQSFVSQLLIFDFSASDAGNYSCRSIPQYSEAANVTVNALKDENVQLFFSNHYYSGRAGCARPALLFLLLIQLLLFALRI